jgi:hypothetical protein
MLKRTFLGAAILVALLLPAAFVSAQQAPAAATPTPNPDLLIAWPQPITEVHGVIDVVGTADIPDMAFYRLEAIALNPDYSVPENAAWIPLTTDMTQPVASGVLGQVDTTSLPDGLYNLRVTAFTGTVAAPGDESIGTTGPIRVNNLHSGGNGVTPTPGPTATPAPSNAPPSVVPDQGIPGVYVRSCNIADNNLCPVVGGIQVGGSAQLLGIADDGSGWYYVAAPGGVTGWVSDTVATVEGSTSGVPDIAPPTPQPTQAPPPPPPPAGPTAVPASPVVPNGVAPQGSPQCAELFNVEINLANEGSTPSQPGTVTLQDIHVDDGAVTYTGYGNYPSIEPGANYVVTVGMVSSSYPNTNHELIAYNDGQQFSTRYTLGPGTCTGPAPTPTPQPPPTPSGPPQPSSSQDYSPGQCTITTKGSRTPYYQYPLGPREGTIGDQTFDAVKGEKVNGDRWYMIFLNPGSPDAPVWVRQQDIKNLPSACKKF